MMIINSSSFISLISLPHFTNKTPPPAFLPYTTFTTRTSRRRRWDPDTVLRVSSSDNPTVTISSSSPPPSSSSTTTTTASSDIVGIESGADVVKNFYAGINGHNLAYVEDLIADNCVYEDLVFPRPFVGRKEILQFFKKFIDSISIDLQFVIDDLSTEDPSAVGVTWHLEWKKRPFPFSKGCSFYRLEVVNGKRQIIYARDSVEPAIKPGETALVAIRGVTWLLQQFPQLVDRF